MVVVLDETNILAACISRYKTLKCHVIWIAPLGGATLKPANNVRLLDVIHVCLEFRSLAVSTPPLQMKH